MLLFKLTHKQLVESAYKWVLKRGSCGVAFKEFYSAACNGEYPDVIGFGGWGHSVLIEVKVSRSDFLSDKKKSFRKYPQTGMGSHRYYCCPTGMIKKEELPEGWGLIYVNERCKATLLHRPIIQKTNDDGLDYNTHYVHKKNIKAEHGLMYSALRRLHIRKLIDVIYDSNYDAKTQLEEHLIYTKEKAKPIQERIKFDNED